MGASENKENGFLPGALLVGAVLAILGVGMILSTDAPRESRAVLAQAPPLAAPVSVAEPAEDAPAAEEPPPPAASDLGSRVSADLRRLGQTSGRYTAQLAVACKAETVERLVAASGGADDLYVLPAEVKGASCFRLCWGSYATSDEAARAADLPAALRSSDRPRAVEIVAVLP
jgi:septal ring-binding cell division protein DamX